MNRDKEIAAAVEGLSPADAAARLEAIIAGAVDAIARKRGVSREEAEAELMEEWKASRG